MFFRENNFRKCPAYDGRPTRSTDYLVWFSPPEARKGSRAHPHSCAIIAVRRPLLLPLFYDVSAELIALYADKEVECAHLDRLNVCVNVIVGDHVITKLKVN